MKQNKTKEKTSVQTRIWDDILNRSGFSMKNFPKSLQNSALNKHMLLR